MEMVIEAMMLVILSVAVQVMLEAKVHVALGGGKASPPLVEIQDCMPSHPP